MSAVDIPMVFVRGNLIPADDAAREALSSLSQGSEVLIQLKAKRNVRRHRLAWGIISLVHRNTNLVPSAANLMDCAKVDLGHVEARSNPFTGECWTVPKSIAFHNMGEVEFGQFVRGLVDLVCTRWLVGTDRQELRREVEAIVDGAAMTSLGRRAA
jgi:hypothetical protein